MNNKEIFDNLYKNRSQLERERSPIKYRLENNPEDKKLTRLVKQYNVKIQALTEVMKIYSENSLL